MADADRADRLQLSAGHAGNGRAAQRGLVELDAAAIAGTEQHLVAAPGNRGVAAGECCRAGDQSAIQHAAELPHRPPCYRHGEQAWQICTQLRQADKDQLIGDESRAPGTGRSGGELPPRTAGPIDQPQRRWPDRARLAGHACRARAAAAHCEEAGRGIAEVLDPQVPVGQLPHGTGGGIGGKQVPTPRSSDPQPVDLGRETADYRWRAARARAPFQLSGLAHRRQAEEGHLTAVRRPGRTSGLGALGVQPPAGAVSGGDDDD